MFGKVICTYLAVILVLGAQPCCCLRSYLLASISPELSERWFVCCEGSRSTIEKIETAGGVCGQTECDQRVGDSGQEGCCESDSAEGICDVEKPCCNVGGEAKSGCSREKVAEVVTNQSDRRDSCCSASSRFRSDKSRSDSMKGLNASEGCDCCQFNRFVMQSASNVLEPKVTVQWIVFESIRRVSAENDSSACSVLCPIGGWRDHCSGRLASILFSRWNC